MYGYVRPFILFKTKVMHTYETDHRNNRIDFAPKVDLGFMLITFFVFTTSLMEQKAFQLHVPDDDLSTTVQSPVSATITLTLQENGAVDYLEGSNEHILAKGTAYLYGNPSLRDYLINKRQRIIQQLGSDSQYTVLIQRTAQSNYKELIDVLDEMSITAISKYVLIEEKPRQ